MAFREVISCTSPDKSAIVRGLGPQSPMTSPRIRIASRKSGFFIMAFPVPTPVAGFPFVDQFQAVNCAPKTEVAWILAVLNGLLV